jgi:hypothetical protein
VVVLFRHALAYPCLVEESPCGQLLQDADPGEDVEVVEFDRVFFDIAEGIAQGCFCQVLSSRVFGKYFRSV